MSAAMLPPAAIREMNGAPYLGQQPGGIAGSQLAWQWSDATASKEQRIDLPCVLEFTQYVLE